MAQINFKGKSIVWNHHLGVEYHELVPDKSKSLTDSVSLKDNLIIHGDNLKALKALLPTYAGKVKCIYIDPPYNTGEEGWAYSDNIGSPMMQQWLKEEVVDKDDLTRHDKWLCMMTPRLKLLRELLGEDGTIFISIDYNENYHLRQLCDEIFGEKYFVGEIYWESKTKSQNTETSYNKLQPKAESILVYAKQTKKRFNLISVGLKKYPEKDEKGPYRYSAVDQMNLAGVRGRESMVFGIKGVYPKEGFQWKQGLETINSYIARNDVVLKSGKPTLKVRPEDERGETTQPFWGFFGKDIGTAESAKRELTEILGNHSFETVKPVELIKRLIYHLQDPVQQRTQFWSSIRLEVLENSLWSKWKIIQAQLLQSG
jgi:adenine-specific DNA-methyltransferase